MTSHRIVAGAVALCVSASPLAARTPIKLTPIVYTQQGVAAGAHTTVLVLDIDGGLASITSTTSEHFGGARRLDTNRGYWSRCGSWRVAADGQLTVRDRLEESFAYYPPPQPLAWTERRYAMTGALRGQVRMQLADGDGRRFAATTAAPIDDAMIRSLRFTCHAGRSRHSPAT